MAELTERRKADRKKMSEQLFEIVKGYDLKSATLTKEGDCEAYPRAAIVGIVTSKGLRCRFEFDGESCQHDIYVNAWNMSFETDYLIGSFFPGGNPNPHGGKCTTTCDGFTALCAHVVAVLEADKAGSIYDAEKQAKRIAKEGTWQERKARWDEYFDAFAAKKPSEAA